MKPEETEQFQIYYVLSDFALFYLIRQTFNAKILRRIYFSLLTSSAPLTRVRATVPSLWSFDKGSSFFNDPSVSSPRIFSRAAWASPIQ